MLRVHLRAILAILFAVLVSAPVWAQNRQRIQCFTTYDEDFFYFAATVQKPSLVGKNAAPFGNPLTDDAISVFLQKGESGEKRTADSVQMAVSAAGGAQIYRGADAAPLSGFQDFRAAPDGSKVPFKYRAVASEDLNKPGTPATAYTVEMAVPWIEIGRPPKPGNRMRFNVVAYSAAPGSSPTVSLSSEVKTPADIQNPARWTEVIFVDAAVRQVESAPNARITPRVFSQKPLIDGVISPGEWNPLTAFAFGEGAGGGPGVGFTPNATTGRARPKVNLSKAPPRIAIPRKVPTALNPRKPLAVSRLVFAVYDYGVQADPRKKLPLKSPRNPDGTSLIATHPLDGEGPWMTYDRVDWHVQNADQMKQSGVDALAAIYRVSSDASGVQGRTGLLALAAGLRALQANGRRIPGVALLLDTESLFSRGKSDLKDPTAQARLYGAIKEFFLHIPRHFRLAVPVDIGSANVVVLSSAAPFGAIDPAFVGYCRGRFHSDFGTDLVMLGPGEFKPASLDGYVNLDPSSTFEDSGFIKTAIVSTGVEGDRGPNSRPRREGETYRSDWKSAIERGADWIFIRGWHDFKSGSEVAPTLEHGFRYSDLTRLLARSFTQNSDVSRAPAQENIPDLLPAGLTASLSVRLRNSESGAWTPDKNVVTYQWQRSGSPSGPIRTVPLPEPVPAGQGTVVSFLAPTPTVEGEYTLLVNVARLDRSGAPEPPKAGATPAFSRAIRISDSAESSKSSLSALVTQSDLPFVVEAGGTYAASVTFKNTGEGTWKKANGARITARLDRFSSGARGESAESISQVEIADATVELPADVAPGQEIAVRIPVTFSSADGEFAAVSSGNPDWTYLLSYEISVNGGGVLTEPQAMTVVERDFGGVFTSALMPPQLPAGKAQPVRLSVRNAGPQAWLKEATAVSYHWYYLDGVEVLWDGEMTALPRDVEPGGEITDLLANVTPPPTDGRYWLVWDIKIGDTWQSSLPGARANETRVYAVDVVKGSLKFVDLARSYNLDGISSEAELTDGSIDSGHAFPASQVPPFAIGEVAPSSLWLPLRGTGFAGSRGIGFKWGPRGPKEKNFIQAVGQKVPLNTEPSRSEIYRSVHILAAATSDISISTFLLEFSDGTQQLSSVPISRWDAPPAHGEEVAYAVTRTVSSGNDPKPVHLYRYTIRVGEAKRLAALILPNSPAIKIAAITLER